uniref:Uncharacterized protein n=1 Tax=Arundo donax TaxID=35708 RepID=A0A0A8YXU4_ARUDO
MTELHPKATPFAKLKLVNEKWQMSSSSPWFAKK